MIKWNKYTWYSKWASLIFFIIVLPILTFYIGMKYQEARDVLVSDASAQYPVTFVQHTKAVGKSTELIIYVPKNPQTYHDKVLKYWHGDTKELSLGDSDFMTKKVMGTTTSSYGVEQASVDAAAATVKTQTVIKTVYFKIEAGTAYVLLNIYVDGWAGVSLPLAEVDPIIRKTLSQFPTIKEVQLNTRKVLDMWKPQS